MLKVLMIVYRMYFAFSHCCATMDLLQKFKWLYKSQNLQIQTKTQT